MTSTKKRRLVGKLGIRAGATNQELIVCLFKKMADSLAKYGIYIDDLSKIRVLEPEVANQANKLKEECQNFISSEFYRSRYNDILNLHLFAYLESAF